MIDIDPTLHRCPTPDCTYFVQWKGPEEGPPICECPLCLKSTCLACVAQPYHVGKKCSEYQKEKQELREFISLTKSPEQRSKATEDYLKKSNIRICKRCGNGIVKAAGCNKMKCRCGYRMCYVCGVENAQCEHTPASHGFIDNLLGRAEFNNLQDKKSPT